MGWGFRGVSGFGFRVSVFGFRFSGFGFRVPGFGFRISGFGLQVSSQGCRGEGFNVSGALAFGEGLQKVSEFGVRGSDQGLLGLYCARRGVRY